MSLFFHEQTQLYVDGHFRKLADVRLSPYDQGFLYGASVFATFPIEPDGNVPFWDQHRERLKAACTRLGIIPREGFFLRQPALRRTQILAELLRRNHAAPEGAIGRYRITAGEAGPGLPTTPTYPEPHDFLDLRPFPAPEMRARPAVLHLLKTIRDHGESAPRMKAGAYLNTLLAHREAISREIRFPDEGLLLDDQGYLSEGVTSNIFWISGQTLFTPSLATGCLPGTTREWVIDYARAADIDLQEGTFRMEDLPGRAQAAFLTNSVRGLHPVVRVEGDGVQPALSLDPENTLLRNLRRAWKKARSLSLSGGSLKS